MALKSKSAITLGSSILLVLGFISISDIHAQTPEPLPLEDLQVFSEVFGKIKNEYVDPVDDATLLQDAIRGMLAGLDPHSTFLDAEDFKEIKISTDGKFGGLGIEVTTENGLIKVVAPMDGTPAHDAGIQPGDFILMIDGAPVRGMALQDAVDNMRGPPGSEIVLTISRDGLSEPLEINLVRAIIKVTSVWGEILEQGFGYIRLSSFQSGTAQSLRNQVNRLVEINDGALDGLVLDLRNNPGGVLHGAVEVSDMFLGEGEIVSTRGKTSIMAQRFLAKPDDIIGDAPMVVLVNGGSASASEIVAGALQDHQRALILGTKTFGKGSVQTVIPLNNGGALKITTARYYTPSNRSIQAKGIIPDIIAEQVTVPKPLDSKNEISESDLSGHLENDNTNESADKSVRSNGADLVRKDHQLQEALNLLKGMALVRNRQDSAGG